MGPPLHAKVNGCDVWLTKDEADHNVVCIGIHGLIRSEAVRKTDERWDPEMIPAMPTSPLSAIKMLIVLSLLQNMMVCVMFFFGFVLFVRSGWLLLLLCFFALCWIRCALLCVSYPPLPSLRRGASGAQIGL